MALSRESLGSLRGNLFLNLIQITEPNLGSPDAQLPKVKLRNINTNLRQTISPPKRSVDAPYSLTPLYRRGPAEIRVQDHNR